MENYVLGVDIGSGSVKLTLLSKAGRIAATAGCEYPTHYPHVGWCEQDPEDWCKAFRTAFADILSAAAVKAEQIEALALDAATHTAVLLDEKLQIIRPAILWTDQRSKEEVQWLKVKEFKGVYNRERREVELFSDTKKGTRIGEVQTIGMEDPAIEEVIGEDAKALLEEEIELLDGAAAEFEQELVSKGELSPVFFGSALTNFGVETFLQHFLKMTSSPLPRVSDHGVIDPMEEKEFSAFVFKIQANMNKAHRDRIAFMRICSGKFEAGMNVYHVQGKKEVRLSQPQQMMASERKIIENAYGGDIIGVFDPGIFSIGDTLTTSKEKFAYEGIPTFAPEHFARVRQMDTMKRKQFVKGINQIAQEGAIQIFQEFNTGMEEIIVGVVGVLQFDVLKYRLENEYNVEIRLETLPYEHIRWIENEEINMDKLIGTSDMKKIKDLKDRPLLLFVHEWSIRMTQERNKDLILSEFGRS